MQKKLLWSLILSTALLSFWGLYVLVASGPLGIVAGTLILWVLGIAFVVFMDKVGLRFILVWFAEQDKWWSPVRMKPGPGHIVMMTRGMEPGGPFDRVLTGHIPYWRYDTNDRSFHKDPNEIPVKETGILTRAGVVWVGFVRRHYRRRRRWDVWDLIPGKTEYGVIRKETKKEEEHIFYFATTMAVGLETVPTADAFPAQMKIVFNVLFIHPEKAEFTAGKWEVQAVAAVRARALQYIQSKKLAELRLERDRDRTNDFVDTILKANEKQGGETGTVGLLPEYGVMIQGPYYEDFDLESGDVDMVNALKRQQIAAEDIKTAQLRAQEATELGKGEANRRREAAVGIRATVEAWGTDPVGATVAMAEAIKEAQPSVIGGNIMAGVNQEPRPRKPKK